MGFRLGLLVPFLVFLISPIRSETVENPDFLRGDSIYKNGKGDPAEFPKAIEAFKRAAEKGDARGQFFLGRMYHFGHGVPVSLELAERWYLAAGEKDINMALNNLGVIYSEQGKPGEVIMRLYARSSELGNAQASFNMGKVFNLGSHGVPKDFVRALECYHKALVRQPGYPNAWRLIGLIHETGGFGVDRDPKSAETAYLTGIRENDDRICHYRLYLLYDGGIVPPGDMPVIAHLVKAAELGFRTASCRAAFCYLSGRSGVKPDLVKVAYFSDLSAKQGCPTCKLRLSEKAKDQKVVEHYGKEVTQAWIDQWNAYTTEVGRNVVSDLAKVRPVFASGDEISGNAMIDEMLERWTDSHEGIPTYVYTDAIWNEAQIGGGRGDLEWGRFLYTWLTEFYEGDRKSNGIIGARSNLNERLMELGRYGLLRDSCVKSKQVIRELEGVDVDAVLKSVSIGPDFTVVGAENLPLFGDVEMAERSRRMPYEQGISSGDMIGGSAMNMMVPLARERLSVGDWKGALVFAEWGQRWAEKLTAEKMEPKRGYPGCLGELQRLPYDLKADVFAALGLPEMAAAACQKIIDWGFQKSDFGGRDFRKAQYRLAGIQVDQGEAGKVDIAMLKDIEDKKRVNQYDESHAWQFAKLVRARVLAEVEGIEVARPLVSEVLASSSEDKRPLLRLEALLVSADLELKAGNPDGVVRSLEEALSWARGQGLLLSELRTDELYVTYLIKIGDCDQALAMQRRVLELIDALKLSPRRELAILRLAEIHGLRRNNTAALALLKEIKSPSLANRVNAVGERLKLNGTSEPAAKPVTMEQITLQPMGIQSMPLRQEAEAVFILSNPNPGACAVELTLECELFGLVLEDDSKEEVVIRSSTSQEAGSHRLVAKVEVPGTGQLPVTLSAGGLGSLERDMTVSLQAMASACPVVQKSEWLIRTKGNEVAVAVIDAAQLKNSAFCLVPVYHHLDALDRAEKSTALRVVASEPTRVEGYASDGTLLFVDAQGNGSFRDPGDLIATSMVNDLFPVIEASLENGRIGLRYRPESSVTTGRVELRIETHTVGEESAWKVDAIDWLER